MSGATARIKLAVMPKTADEEGRRPILARACVVSNKPIAPEHWLLTLRAPEIARSAAPGQFVMLTVVGNGEMHPLLPRPMALYSYQPASGSVQVLYRVIGEGTRRMSRWRAGELVCIVGPLGRPFVVWPWVRNILLIGRGIGVCSLTALSEEAVKRGIRARALISARYPAVALGLDWFSERGVPTWVVTDAEGTSAVPFVRERLEGMLSQGRVDVAYVCGSKRLIGVAAELAERYDFSLQVSLESRMACGLGYCHACSTGCPGLDEETPMVCREGPVFSYIRGLLRD